jgi:hypothetical protein
MTKTPEPEYRTAYESSGKHIDPETGKDLSDWSAESVRAYAEDLFPHYARENFSEEAAARKAILLKIAKEKDK